MSSPFCGQVRVKSETVNAVKIAAIKRGKNVQEMADEILSREAKKINAGK